MTLLFHSTIFSITVKGKGKDIEREENTNMFLKIRPETPSDDSAINKVNDLAFGQPNEGKFIENLRKIRNLSQNFYL